ncbi:MAG: transglycosylase family protein, partial [Acidobacteriota bacterium]
GKAHAESNNKPEEKHNYVTVERGDYLDKIAHKHKTTYHRIYFANEQIKHPDLIYPDQKLRIPNEEEKLKKRPLPSDAHVTAETESDKQLYRNSYSSGIKSRTKWKSPVVSSASGDVWDRLAACESGGNWSINTGNGYFGGLQFTLGTWQAVGGSGYPHQASRAEQINRGKILQARSGWGQWPACAAKLGLL